MRLPGVIRRCRKIVVTAISSIMIIYMIVGMETWKKFSHPSAKLSNSVKGHPSADLYAMKRDILPVKNSKTLVAKPLSEINAQTSFSLTSKISTITSTNLPNVTSRNVFYNRIGKCASRSLIEVAKAITKVNNFTAVESSNYWDDHPEYNAVLQELMKIAELQPPTFYNRHIHYLDFQNFSQQSPIYINMVRDPISRFVSAFNYMKYGDDGGMVRQPYKNLSHINRCVMNDEPYCRRPKTPFYYTNYFCGFDPICTDSSPLKRVELAKKHIDENYLVIGLTEEFENTLKLLEKMVPAYFYGASDVWKLIGRSMRDTSKTKKKDVPSEEVTKKLRYETLTYEYMIYNHAKAKFEQLKLKHGIS